MGQRSNFDAIYALRLYLAVFEWSLFYFTFLAFCKAKGYPCDLYCIQVCFGAFAEVDKLQNIQNTALNHF